MEQKQKGSSCQTKRSVVHARLLSSGRGEYHLGRQTIRTIVTVPEVVCYDDAVHDNVLLFLLFVTIVHVIVVVDQRRLDILAFLRKPHGMFYIHKVPEQKLR